MLELEVEIKDGGTELEVVVEIKWAAGDAAPSSAPDWSSLPTGQVP